MKRILMAVLLAMIASSAHAAGAMYLGTDNQDTTITGQTQQLLIGTTEQIQVEFTPGQAVPIVSTDTLNVEVVQPLPAGGNNIGDVDLASPIPAGTNNIGDVDLASPIPAGTNNIGDVDIASELPAGTNNIGDVDLASPIPAGTNVIGEVKVTDGTDDVEVNSDGSLNVKNLSRPSLENRTAVTISSNSLTASDIAFAPGLAKSVTLHALRGACTFEVYPAAAGSGAPILMEKNTAEVFEYDYTLTDATVELTSKDAAATCKARVISAN